uniref:Uncharacterized protein n=1 Tax=Strongyloides venezuelensis TaxID=75913 RepID=A0A0K0EXW0_STRVS
MSIFDELRSETGLPDAVFCLIAILLILLTSIVWVAFCVVLHRTVYRMAEFKRQQRRQQIISSAFALTAQEFPHLQGISPTRMLSELSQLDPVIFAHAQQYDYNPTELPSYHEALQLPSPNGAERINSINNAALNITNNESNNTTVMESSHISTQNNDIEVKDDDHGRENYFIENNISQSRRIRQHHNNSRNRTHQLLSSLPPLYNSLRDQNEP